MGNAMMIPEVKESRAERLRRQAQEQKQAKLEAKEKKGKPEIKSKVNMKGIHQTIEYTPEKEVPVLIDLPKQAKRIKSSYSKVRTYLTKHKGIVIAAVTFFTFMALFLLAFNQAHQAPIKDAAETKIAVNSSPTITTHTSKNPTKKVGVPVANEDKASTTTQPVSAVSPPAVPVVPTKDITVQEGDTLWSLAVDLYGDGTRWIDIWEQNKDVLTQGDIRNVNTPGHWIHKGQVLKVKT